MEGPSEPGGARPPEPAPADGDASSSTDLGEFTAQEALNIGDLMAGRFRIIRLLGSGGMSRVYEAEDELLHDRVALKVMLSEEQAVSEDTMTARFEREAQLAKKITHPNVCRIHDIGVDSHGRKPLFFLTMELLEGETLERRLECGGMKTAEALPIVRQLVAALQAAHESGVIHRDFKSANVILTPGRDPGTVRAVVTDFGLARAARSGSHAPLTRDMEIVGTPDYMAPEQVLAQPVSPATDVYSLGIVLYEMVTGELPFRSETPIGTALARVHTEPQPPLQHVPELSPVWNAVILRCLAREPGKRYQTAAEVLEALEGRTAAFWPPSRRTVVAGVCALAILVATAGAYLLWRARGTSAPDKQYVGLLPLQAAPGASVRTHVARGLLAGVANRLAAASELYVATPPPQMAVDGLPLAKVARELGVTLLVHGAYAEDENGFSAEVSLDDVRSSKRLWTSRYSGSPSRLLEVEDRIYRDLAGALGIRRAEAAAPTADIEAFDLYLRGQAAMAAQKSADDIQKGIEYFESALKRDPRFSLASASLADAFLGMYRRTRENAWVQKSIHTALLARQAAPGVPEVHFILGDAYAAVGRSGDAVAELKAGLALAPDSDFAYRRLGSAYLSDGKQDLAFDAFRKAVEINPNLWGNYYRLGGAYFKAGQTEQALDAYRRVAEIRPDLSRGHEGVAAVYFRQGKYRDSAAAYEKALSIEPAGDNYSNLGAAWFYLGEYQSALKVFQKALALDPNNERNLGNLADTYRQLGQQAKALEMYQQAIARAYKDLSINPRDAGRMGSLALYYAKTGAADRAREFIARARRTDPSDIDLMYTEASVSAIGGKVPEAIAALRSAFQKGYPPAQARIDPDLSSLRNRPEFSALLQEFSGRR